MDDKRKVSAAVIVIAVFLLFCQAAARAQGMGLYKTMFFGYFDTMTGVSGYAKNEEEFHNQAELLRQKLEHYHKLFDVYHTYDGINNLKTVNDAAAKQPVEVEPELISLLKFGKEMYQKTGGKINIAYGGVLSVWHEYREEGLEDPKRAELPPEDLLASRAAHTDPDQIILNETDGTVYIQDPEVSIDVGSIGKGYAAQRLVEYAREIGLEYALFSLGGNVCTTGAKADGFPWHVGIENPDPDGSEAYVRSVGIWGGSLVTSGNYQRYYEVDGKRYCHIINPDTGMPASYFPSVTVMAEDSGVADALSTALFNMEFEEGLAFVESLDGVEALWIFEDGGIRSSSGFVTYE
ncbi:FAD:protein FMN transferase [Lachnospiraceae bacterium 29-84]